VGAILLNYIGSAYEHAGELLNFGAFLAFMGVNAATFWQFSVVAKPRYVRHSATLLIALAAYVFLLTGDLKTIFHWVHLDGLYAFFAGLPFLSMYRFAVIGGIALGVGAVYIAIQTCGFGWRAFADALFPFLGFGFCAVIWFNLNIIAKTVGGIWFAIGILYVGYKTNWFRSTPVMIDFSDN